MTVTPTRAQLEQWTMLAEELMRRQKQRQFYLLYPNEDRVLPNGDVIHARHKYPRHLEFFSAGAQYRERCFMAANRVGKTYGGGGFELTCHLTGDYPPWWDGRRFDRPIRAWAAGKTNETTRDIIQRTLLGEVVPGARKGVDGTGIVPGALLGPITWKQGVADLVDTIKVKHKPSGMWSSLGLKSYQQGRGSFEGTAQHAIWLDEEPPMDVYQECLVRTATVRGIVMLTFTPLEGLSEVVLQFQPADMRPSLDG